MFVQSRVAVGARVARTLLRQRLGSTGRVEKCESPQRLLVVTKHANASDEQVIETMLTAEGNQTILAWEERGIPADLVAAYGAGVQVHVEDLAADLAGDECCDAAARFNELFPTNQELAAKVS